MLSHATLVDEIRKIVDPTHPDHHYPTSYADAAQRWTDAYATIYAGDAEDYSGDAVATKNDAGCLAILAANMPSNWTATQAATMWQNAFEALWTGGIFGVGSFGAPGGECPNVGGTMIFSVEISSLVTVVSGATLKIALIPEFNDLSYGDLEQYGYNKANDLADIFHAHIILLSSLTTLITGLDTTPPPVGPLPCANTCHIY